MNKDIRMCCFTKDGMAMGRWFSLCHEHREKQKVPEGMVLKVGEHVAVCSECNIMRHGRNGDRL